MKKFPYYAAIGVIFLLSFRFYSSLYYPALNSDNAVTILMIHFFKLPNDLYFWGQDRMGSLIPLLGQIPFKALGFSALTSEAITRYAILLLGFLAFSTILKSDFYRLIFAIVWFFPPMRFIDVTQFAFGIHYSLIAISCCLFIMSNKENIKGRPLAYHAVLLLLVIVLIAAVWVSDMAMVSVFLLLCIQLYYYLRRNKLTKDVFSNPQLYYAIAGLIVGYLFIHFAKDRFPVRQNYAAFSNPAAIKQVTMIFLKSVTDLLLFKSNEIFTGIYSYLILILIVLSFFVWRKLQVTETIRKWALFFLLDAIVLFSIIIVSQWTLLNNVPRRYFTCTYISFSFTLVLFFDNLSVSRKLDYFFKVFIVITVLTGGIGTLYNLKYIWPKTMVPMVKLAGEFRKLGKIGILSEYWNSYINAVPDPDNIKVTPNEKSYVRNRDFVDSVFAQPRLYVIRDMWMDAFPDTLEQFGYVLLKNGNEFKLGGCSVCSYKKSKIDKVF